MNPTDDRLHAVSVDLTALEAIVRALIQVQARRSPTALGDLLQALSEQVERLRAESVLPESDATAAGAVVESWIDAVKQQALAA